MSEESTDTSRSELGERVRALREARGLTLQVLSDRSGLAISTISKIERGLMAPTYDRFAGLANGLGVDVAALFSSAGNAFEVGTVAVARAEKFDFLQAENYTYQMLFTETHNKSMTPMIGVLQPRTNSDSDRMFRHPGQEFLMVLAGMLVIEFEDKDDVLLETGDSIYFDCGQGHRYQPQGDEEVRAVVVITPSCPEDVQHG